MEDEIIEQPNLADATDLESFKKLRYPKPDAAAEPAVEKTPQTEEVTPAESATPAGSVETKVQESEALPSVDTSIDEQIKGLRKAGKHAAANKLEREAGRAEAKAEREAVEAKNRELESELNRLRAGSSEAKPPAIQAVPQASGDPEPKVTDAKYQVADGYQNWIIDKAKWEFRADNRRAEETKAVETRKARAKSLMEAGNAKNADFGAVTGKVFVSNDVLVAGIERVENFGDVLYAIGSDPAETARIKALPPNDQWYEIRSLSAKLASPAAPAAAPVVLKPAVSKVAPAPRVLTGVSDQPAKSTADATSYEEYRRIRRKAS